MAFLALSIVMLFFTSFGALFQALIPSFMKVLCVMSICLFVYLFITKFTKKCKLLSFWQIYAAVKNALALDICGQLQTSRQHSKVLRLMHSLFKNKITIRCKMVQPYLKLLGVFNVLRTFSSDILIRKKTFRTFSPENTKQLGKSTITMSVNIQTVLYPLPCQSKSSFPNYKTLEH